MATITTFYGIIIPICYKKDLLKNEKLSFNDVSVFYNVEPLLGLNFASFNVSATKIVFLPLPDPSLDG